MISQDIGSIMPRKSSHNWNLSSWVHNTSLHSETYCRSFLTHYHYTIWSIFSSSEIQYFYRFLAKKLICKGFSFHKIRISWNFCQKYEPRTLELHCLPTSIDDWILLKRVGGSPDERRHEAELDTVLLLKQFSFLNSK